MWKSKLALVCLLAAGCKNASVDSATENKSEDTGTAGAANGAPHRNGKIDLGARKPRAPLGSDPADDNSAGASETRQQDFEERRRARIAQFDADGDGKISDDERKVARHKRAEDMRKQADANNDGKLTVEEMSKGTFRRLDPEGVDANKDGDISVEEIEAALDARNKAWGGGRFRGGERFGRMTRDKMMNRDGQGSAAPATGSAAPH